MKTTKILGFLGLMATVLVGLGEYNLHFSQEVINQADNYQFLKFVPKKNLFLGHFLAIIGLPFYFAGYFHIYRMLKSGNRIYATAVLFLGIVAFAVGGVWIGSRAFLGTIVHLQQDINTNTYQSILDSYTNLLEILVKALRIVMALLSVCFVVAVLKGNTYYKKWMAFFNPITILIILLSTLLIPSLGKYIVPILMNVTHFIFFSVSLYQLYLYNHRND